MAIDLRFTFKDRDNNATAIGRTSVSWTLTNAHGVAVRTNTEDTDDSGMITISGVAITPADVFTFSYNIASIPGTVGPIKLTFNLRDGGIFARAVLVSAGGLLAPAAAAVNIAFTNPRRDWLSYETRFNWPQFAKTNQKFTFRIYRVELKKLLLIFADQADGLDDETLGNIRDVFFPSVLSLSTLRELGKPPWAGPRKIAVGTPLTAVTTRDRNSIYATYAYMPFNVRDNRAGEINKEAIGTRRESRSKRMALVPFQTTLDGWNTASRSSIVKIKLDSKITFKDEFKHSGNLLWPEAEFGQPKPDRFLSPPPSGTEFRIQGGAFHRSYFSLKTGTNIIGLEIQDNKAILEHNSILAALRSAYVREIERKFAYDSFNDPELLILTEIATVTEADPGWDNWMFPLGKDRTGIKQPKFGDGYQIRSLQGMRSDKEYLPPLSIPYLRVAAGKVDTASSCDFTQQPGQPFASSSDFSQIDDPEWLKFWERHFAEGIGRAKAQLLLRYAMQGFGGNSQNFLLEMDDGVPNGRVVFRDMGDYALHDYVLWALFGPGKTGTPPPSFSGLPLDGQDRLVAQWKAGLDSKLLKFECDDLHQYVDDGGQMSEFPTFTGYHRSPASGMHTFNPFCSSCARSDSKPAPSFVGHISPLYSYLILVSPNRFQWFETTNSPDKWARIFNVQFKWGVSFVKAWTKYIERAMGQSFFIDWYLYDIDHFIGHPSWAKTNDVNRWSHRMFDPSAFLRKSDIDLWKDMYEKLKTWEMYVGWQVEQYLATAEGQNAIVAYKNRRWTPLAPALKVRVTDAGDQAVKNGTVMMKYRNKIWNEATDANGIAEVFGINAYSCQVGALSLMGDEVYVGVAEIKARANKKADFGTCKIEVL